MYKEHTQWHAVVKYTSWRVGGVDTWLSDFGQKKLRVVSVGYLPLRGNTSPAVLRLLYAIRRMSLTVDVVLCMYMRITYSHWMSLTVDVI